MSVDFPAVWSSKELRWQSPDGRFYFDAPAADTACQFFPDLLKHHIGEFAGQPFELMQYQAKLLTRPIFGWKRASDGLRRIRKLFAFIPKGGGKSPWSSGTMIYLVRCDGEAAAEGYALANDRNQARTVHENCKIMVEESPHLAEGAEILKDSIYWRASRSTLQVLSSEASSAHGKRPHVLSFDELHGFVGDRDRELFEALTKSLGKRRQPLLIIITHAGTDDEGLCVAPDTKLLTADLRWVRAGDVVEGDVLVGFDEKRKGSAHRTWEKSVVLKTGTLRRPSYELVLTDGTTVVCSEDHLWLVQTAGRRVIWRKTKDLTPTDEFFRVADTWETDTSHGAGYLAGLLDGEGHLSKTKRAKCLCGFTQIPNGVSAEGQRLLTERGLRWGVYGGAVHGRSARQTMVTTKHEVVQLLGSVRPRRLLDKFDRIAFGATGIRMKSHAHPTLASKTFVGVRTVVGLQTSTRTYIAEGLASHNCFEEYEYAKGVLSGTIPDETCLPVVFEAQSGEDWTSPEVLRRVHPGYGITVKADALATDLLAAQTDPRKQNDYKRYYLNIWTNQASAWIPVEWWDACNEPMPSDEELATLPCALGIDMAQKIDLASIVTVFRLPLKADPRDTTIETTTETEDGAIVKAVRSLNYRIAILPAFWLPEDTLRDRVRQDNIRYDIYRDQKLLNVTEGPVIDSDAMVRYVKHPDKRETPMDLATRFPLVKQAEIGYDPAFATEIALQLRDRCGFKDKTVEVLQNYKHLSEACQVFEALVKAGRVIHGGHRLLRWNLENVAIKTDDAGRIRPVKPRRATKRIDGIVATIIALSRIMVMPEPRNSVFKKRGALVWTPGGGFAPVEGHEPPRAS